jgi:hypothetical protein
MTVMSDSLQIPAWYYQQFDADLDFEVPGEGYGGWQLETLALSREHTAVVVMHAWDAGTPEEHPGWYRVVEYIPRQNEIVRTVFPPLLAAVRASDLPLLHVVGGGDYYKDCPGYQRAVELAGPAPDAPEAVEEDPALEALRAFKREHVLPGLHNDDDIKRGVAKLDFPEPARPLGDEGIAENGHQLLALCRDAGINHLVYCGFAINWCLLLSPGGMSEMSRHGIMCSALREATTAVENRETAREQIAKEIGLWRVALAFGFVFDVDDFIRGIAPDTEEDMG